METFDRRTFLVRSAAVAGGLAIAGPLEAFGARVRTGRPVRHPGYGPLVDMGDLWLPEGFQYRIISKRGDPMSDVDPVSGLPNPTPSRFDGMAAFVDRQTGDTVLVRNHENRSRRNNSVVAETPVRVPNPYDGALRPQDGTPFCRGGVTKLVIRNRQAVSSTALLGGTIWNCAGGTTPWGTWLSCEEEAIDSGTAAAPIPHGYVFEVDSAATTPVDPRPIRAAGRFDHEAVVWHDRSLYLTEDRGVGPAGTGIPACFYRYTPERTPRAFGDLAASSGPLQALVVDGYPNLNTSTAWPVPLGEPLPVSWVTVPNPDPATAPNESPNAVRVQAQALGAARFERTEGCWLGEDRSDRHDDDHHRNGRRRRRERIYFDCTTGGPLRLGQIWELDPDAMELRLIYQSDDAGGLFQPDNLTVAPTGDLFICEDTGGDPLPHLRGLTPDGRIFDFARAGRGGLSAGVNGTEFCGVCFAAGPRRKRGHRNKLRHVTLYVNQQGEAPATGAPAVTYAIWGPWKRRGEGDDD